MGYDKKFISCLVDIINSKDEKSRMLMWICVHARRDKIRNEDIWDDVGMVLVLAKMKEIRLRVHEE